MSDQHAKEREEFEAWFSKEFLEPTAENDFIFKTYAYGYLLADVQKAFIAWQHQQQRITELEAQVQRWTNHHSFAAEQCRVALDKITALEAQLAESCTKNDALYFENQRIERQNKELRELLARSRCYMVATGDQSRHIVADIDKALSGGVPMTEQNQVVHGTIGSLLSGGG